MQAEQQVVAQPQASTISPEENITQQPDKNWSKGAEASFSTDLDGNNPVKSFSGRVGYKPNDDLGFSIAQNITQKFYIYPNEDELSLSDTVISASYSVGEMFQLGHSFAASMSLPISEESRDNEKYTTISISWSANHTPFEKISFSYGLSARGYLSKYQSQISGDGLGGAPFPIASTGFSHGCNYQLMENLGFNYSISNSRVWYYDLNPDEALGAYDVPNDLFSASIGMSFTRDFLTISTGFSKGNLITQRDSLDLAIFDQELSQWYISLGFSM